MAKVSTLLVAVTMAWISSAEAVTLRLLDDGTGQNSKTVTVPQVGGPVTVTLRVVVDLEGSEAVINALTGGIQVDGTHSGQFQIDSYTYEQPYASFDPQGGAAGYNLADSPVGPLSPSNSKATPPYSGVGFFTPSPTGDELIGLVVISSVDPVAPGETVTFSLNGEVAVDGTAVNSPAIVAFTLTTEGAATCSTPTIATAESIKTHGGAGDFGIALGISPAVGDVECRSNNTMRVEVVFSGPVVAADGSLGSGPGNEVEVSTIPLSGVTVTGVSIEDGNTLRILLSNVEDRTCLSIQLRGIACDVGGGVPGEVMSDVTLLQRLLLGDSNGNGVVTSADVAQTKSRAGTADSSSFRSDIVVNGSIGSADENLIKARTDGRQLGCP